MVEGGAALSIGGPAFGFWKSLRNRKIFDLWLAGWTQQEIADAVGMTQGETSKSIPNGNLAELNKTQQNAANHETDSPNRPPLVTGIQFASSAFDDKPAGNGGG